MPRHALLRHNTKDKGRTVTLKRTNAAATSNRTKPFIIIAADDGDNTGCRDVRNLVLPVMSESLEVAWSGPGSMND